MDHVIPSVLKGSCFWILSFLCSTLWIIVGLSVVLFYHFISYYPFWYVQDFLVQDSSLKDESVLFMVQLHMFFIYS